TTPIVTLNPNFPVKSGLFVIFGTGQLLTTADLTTSTTQAIYGVWDNPAAATAITSALLEQQTMTYVSATTSGFPQPVLTETSNSVNWATQDGWYVNLPTTAGVNGQRIVTDPLLNFGSVLLTMNAPPTANACPLTTWTAYALDIQYANGGSFVAAQFDANGDGFINASDLVSGSAPVGLSLGNGYASGISLFATNGTGNITVSGSQSAASEAASTAAVDAAAANNLLAIAAADFANADNVVAYNAIVAADQAAVTAQAAAQTYFNIVNNILSSDPTSPTAIAAVAAAQTSLTAAKNSVLAMNAAETAVQTAVSSPTAGNIAAANTALGNAQSLANTATTDSNNAQLPTALQTATWKTVVNKANSTPWWQVQ
ncbi:MAG TPA: hypothetical protein VK832_12785, partial [Burkholderiaceae bacterium]|nr:hypothetical protein [Burkholderiaceae bacterium]